MGMYRGVWDVYEYIVLYRGIHCVGLETLLLKVRCRSVRRT